MSVVLDGSTGSTRTSTGRWSCRRTGSVGCTTDMGLRYAPADLTLAARDEGFVVERTYEAIDDPSDVRRDPDGTWRIRCGSAVRVTLTMVADARRTHVALVDPLPAGLEAVNPELAVSQTFAPDERDRR
jgi:alpha-2-macroglobulin